MSSFEDRRFFSPSKRLTSNIELPFSSPNQDLKRRKCSLGAPVRVKTPSKSHPENIDPNSNELSRRTSYLPFGSPTGKRSSIESNSSRDSLDNKDRDWRVEDFTLGKPLGKGKFGNVYHAKQKTTNVPIALKVMFKGQMNCPLSLKMLKREVEIQYRLKHENIVKLYGYFHDAKNVYLLLEFAEGGEFFKYLSKNRGLINEDLCCSYIHQITKALLYMHSRHVYHRDLKPENVLIGKNDKLILADFGSAVHAPPPDHILHYTMCGTPEYLSPEMIVGNGHDSSLDMWSLGILMYEILYGRTPFSQKKERQEGQSEEEVEDQARKRMYEKILKYKNDLVFGIPNRYSTSDNNDSINITIDPPSDESKVIMRKLIRANRSERMTSAQLLEDPWFKRISSLTS